MSGATTDRLAAEPAVGALDWSSGRLPAVLLLLSGATLGPHGLALLTPQILVFLDPAAPVAIAALGVMAGLNVRGGRGGPSLAGANVQALVTAVLVAAGLLAIGPAMLPASTFPPWWIVALVAATAAATSSSLPPDPMRTPKDHAVRLEANDCLLPMVMGGVVLALVRRSSPAAALSLASQASVIALLIAVAGWLLLSRASTPAEQRVFTFSSLLLLGGAADYLSVSALLGGLVAGACWQLAGGAVREYVHRDVTYVQHSLLVFVLLLAGAHADFSLAALRLSIPYVVIRAGGKLLGGWLAARHLSAAVSRETSFHLISPGVFGVAFALNVVRAGGAEFAPVLTVVVVGTIASSLLAAFTRPAMSGA